MKNAMMRHPIVFITLIFSLACHAQFYPASTAKWCIWDGAFPLGPNNSPNRHLTLVEGADTLIAGHSYQCIVQYNYYDFTDSWYYETTYYVRSGPSGKGYLYLPDSAAEYLTGDLSAIAGDTVHDILVLYKNPGGCGWDFQLTDAIVDSVVTLTYGGVTVQRHYVHTPCYTSTNFDFIPYWSFWQAGYGPSNGPYLTLSNLLAPVGPACVVADGDFVYSDWSEPLGMPGTPCNCPDLDLGMAEVNRGGLTRISPNPSPGTFTLQLPYGHAALRDLQLFSLQGRAVPVEAAHGSRDEISVSVDAPAGLYTLRLRFADGSEQFAKVVLRP
ncbi:MAG TPA: T9SS type A sorting domain-containing protein [Flavobacteriales bacterium]|nr:T9SS type A sorting domain-containing protein [Flavobacteriales bacterium]